MPKGFNPLTFDPRVLADSFKEELDRQLHESFLPVSLRTSITYEPWSDGKPVITDGHIVEEHPFIWEFTDIAPFYIRLRAYLTYWLRFIHAEIVQVRIASDQFDEMVVAQQGLEDWMNNGGPQLIH